MKFLLNKVVIIIAIAAVVSACSKPTTPKPYGYFRIDLPAPSYSNCTTKHAHFAKNKSAQLIYTDPESEDLFNVHYPSINATIHCTYIPIQGDLAALLTDAQEMVYSHTIKASAIPEQEYTDEKNHIYGMLYELQGNTATAAQFYVTDSTQHFFRASVYINTIPNQDSLAPIITYLVQDTRKMIESFRWQ